MDASGGGWHASTLSQCRCVPLSVGRRLQQPLMSRMVTRRTGRLVTALDITGPHSKNGDHPLPWRARRRCCPPARANPDPEKEERTCPFPLDASDSSSR